MSKKINKPIIVAREEFRSNLANDVKQHYPIAADYNEDGYVDYWSVRYVIPPMLKLIQNQHKNIEQLKQQVNSLMKGGTYEREIN